MNFFLNKPTYYVNVPMFAYRPCVINVAIAILHADCVSKRTPTTHARRRRISRMRHSAAIKAGSGSGEILHACVTLRHADHALADRMKWNLAQEVELTREFASRLKGYRSASR